jgi:hypothetical protein
MHAPLASVVQYRLMRNGGTAVDLRERALLGVLRRSGDEAQLTKALHALFKAEPACGAGFVELLLGQASGAKEVPPPRPPPLPCRAEEVVETGRLDLRFGDERAWDVIVELKLYASYGRDQLNRYLRALHEVKHAYLIAVTRDVPIYGETHLTNEPRWLGSVRWRSLLPGLRALPIETEALRPGRRGCALPTPNRGS